MSNGRPRNNIPFWAENSAYPAGTDPWSSTALKIPPTAAQRNAGHIPGTQQPAQWENSVKNGVARFIDYLVDMPFMNHTPMGKVDETGTQLSLGYAPTGGDSVRSFWSEFHQTWFILGNNTAGKVYFGDPVNGIQLLTLGASKWAFGCISSFGNGVLINGDSGASIAYERFSNALSAVSAGTLPGVVGSGFASSAVTTPSDRFLVVGTADGTEISVWKSDNFGNTWTKVTVAATGFASANMRIVNGHNNEIVIMETGIPSPKAYYSTDNGDTWTLKTLPGGIGMTNLIHTFCYDAEADAYVAATGQTFFVCLGSITGLFTATLLTALLSNISGFALVGNALYFESRIGAGPDNAYHFVSWDLGAHYRKTGFVTYNGGTYMVQSPHSVLWTYNIGVGSIVQGTLRASGLGATARGV